MGIKRIGGFRGLGVNQKGQLVVPAEGVVGEDGPVNFPSAQASELVSVLNEITWDLSLAPVGTVMMVENCDLLTPENMVLGGTYILIVTQDAEGSRTLSWSADYKWPGGVAPTLSTDPGAIDILSFVSDGTSMYGAIQKGFG